jgi:hypothetical protein
MFNKFIRGRRTATSRVTRWIARPFRQNFSVPRAGLPDHRIEPRLVVKPVQSLAVAHGGDHLLKRQFRHATRFQPAQPCVRASEFPAPCTTSANARAGSPLTLALQVRWQVNSSPFPIRRRRFAIEFPPCCKPRARGRNAVARHAPFAGGAHARIRAER